MPHRSITAALNLVIAIAITVGALLSSAHVVAGHNTYAVAVAVAEANRHAEMSAVADAVDHGHSHDDGETAEKQPGHVHGHKPGDHIHEPFGLTTASPQKQPVFAVRAIRPPSDVLERDIKNSFKRPPRLLAV